MKQLLFTLVIVLMSMMASTPCSAKTAIERETCKLAYECSSVSSLSKSNKKNVTDQVPTNIVVKQTTQFKDGRTLIVYYKKDGLQCEVYSPCNANDYDVSDASKIKSSNFEVVDKVEGQLYKKASIDEMIKLVKWLVNKYL